MHERLVGNKMIVTTLEKMESIVSSNKSLSWDGWTVVNMYPSNKGRTSKYGVFRNGTWYMSQRFVPTRDGWSLPDKFMR